MDSNLWLGAVTTLSGTIIGGGITFIINRQQMKNAREQREEEAVREEHQRSLERRLNAYADYNTQIRSFRDSIRPYGQRAVPRMTPDEIGALARSAHTASSLVFLLAESTKTYDACRAVEREMMDIQTVIDDPGSELADKPWPELNERIAGVMREFQVAAREELEVVGVEQSWILDRNRPLGLVAAWRACR